MDINKRVLFDVDASRRKTAEIIENSGMRNKDIAEALQQTESAVCQWRNAKKMPSLDNIILLSDLF